MSNLDKLSPLSTSNPSLNSFSGDNATAGVIGVVHPDYIKRPTDDIASLKLLTDGAANIPVSNLRKDFLVLSKDGKCIYFVAIFITF